METKTKGTQVVVRRSHTPTVRKEKYERLVEHGRKVRAKAAQASAQRVGTLIGGGVGGVAGYLERIGKMPKHVGSPAVLGAVGFASLFVPMKGKLGVVAAEVGASALTLGMYKLGLGQPIIGEDDELEPGEVAGEWGEPA